MEEQFLVYVDGNFLIRNNLKDPEAEPEVLEFEVNIKHLIHFSGRAKIIVVLLEDNRIAFIGVSKGFRLDGTVVLSALDSCSILSAHASEEKLYILCSTAQIVEIENVLLASRLDSQVLEERFRGGQIIKVYKFVMKTELHFSDFYPLSKDSFLLTGKEIMLSWWKVAPKVRGPDLLSNLFKPLMRQEPKSPNALHPPILLEQTRLLNESDREISKILSVSSHYALLEDSVHGRVLQVHLESGMIVKILKGHRTAAAAQYNDNWLLWSGNRGSLQEFSQNPLIENSKKVFSDETIEMGSFCGNFLILFNSETNLLRILQ